MKAYRDHRRARHAAVSELPYDAGRSWSTPAVAAPVVEHPASVLISAGSLLDLTGFHAIRQRHDLVEDALHPDAHLDDWARIGEDLSHMLVASCGQHRDLLPSNFLKLAWRDYIADRLTEGLREERGEQDAQLKLL